MREQDYLERIFKKQNDLQEHLGFDIPSFEEKFRTDYVKEYSLHAIAELNEMLREMPYFKPWKDYSELSPLDRTYKMTKARGEFVDTFHFIINIALALGFTPKTLYDAYMDKNNVNFQRQDEGYKEEGEHE